MISIIYTIYGYLNSISIIAVIQKTLQGQIEEIFLIIAGCATSTKGYG
jgi:hypothetical protein